MVIHVEWLDARYARVEALSHGGDVVGHAVEREAALVISADDAVAIQGSPDQLRRLLHAAEAQLDQLDDTRSEPRPC
jgi:hypothetical protein